MLLKSFYYEIKKSSKQKQNTYLFERCRNTGKFQKPQDAILIKSAFPYKIFEKERTFFKQAVNFHSAILPKYRGRHGSVWAMINDEKELGVSIHEIDESFDNGKILSIESFPIFDEMKLNDIQEEARNCLETALENFFTN